VRVAVDFEKGTLAGDAEKLTVGRGWDTDAAVDPRGRRVAFSAVDVVSQIVTVPLDAKTGRASSPMKPPISREAYDMDPALSPQGTELVFVSSGRWPGFQRVFRASLKKGTLAPLSEDPRVSESNPLFSPDGKWLVFERDRNDSKGDLLLLPREGGAPRK